MKMSLRKNKDGYYIIDSLEKLKEWHKMTDLSHFEKLKEKQDFEKNIDSIKNKSLEKQKRKKVISSKHPTIKEKIVKNENKPEETAFDKWFK